MNGRGAERAEQAASQQPSIPEPAAKPRFEARPYRPDEAQLIYEELEAPNWPRWLEAEPATLAKRAEVFPAGQIALWAPDERPGREGKKRPIAVINLQRFQFDGDPNNEEDVEKLLTWDELCSGPTEHGSPTFEKHYDPKGNTVAMMSINVHKDFQRQGVPDEVVRAVKEMAAKEGVTYVMGSFRPNQMYKYMLENPEKTPEDYMHEKRADGLPIDDWIRNLIRKGMRELKYVENAMQVEVTRDQFDRYRLTHNPSKWVKTKTLDNIEVWLCGETGMWIAGPDSALYIEANIWGILE